MIRHFVLFNLKPEQEAADREWIFEQVKGLLKFPTVKRLAIGKLLEPREDWYKPRISTDFGWALSMEFDDEDGLYAYQTDPYHVAFAQELRRRASLVKVSDFVS